MRHQTPGAWTRAAQRPARQGPARPPRRGLFGSRTALWLPALALAFLAGLQTTATTAQVRGRSNEVLARDGMVAAESRVAAAVGAEVLRRGGNAVDAAVATAFALAVTHPAAGNLGGGGFLLFRAADGRAVAYDFREMAPAGAQSSMFLTNGVYDTTRHHATHLSVGVPGTVAGLHLAWKDHGLRPWAELLQPAIQLAQEGFTVSAGLEHSLSNALPKLRRSPSSLRQFTREGEPLRAGDVLRQPDLARTLGLIAKRGPAGFYRGEIAARMVSEVCAGGGLMTEADLKGYRVRRREPVRGTYRGYEVLSMPPPSSGGICLILMLNLIEGFPVRDLVSDDGRRIHGMVEAMRRAFAVRAHYLADPEAMKDVTPARLLSKAYAARLRASVQPDRASVSSTEGFEWPYESSETTHLSVVDSSRNVVALTYTLEESYGSGLMAPGTGFLLNNEMGDFNAGPGLTTTNGLIGTTPNLAGPRKRMLSSMTPTIILRDGRPFLVLGSPGGRTIITTVFEVVVNVLDRGMNLSDAVAAPRFHHQWFPDSVLYEADAFDDAVAESLRRRGHTLEQARYPQGSVGAIRIDPVTQGIEGVFDRRAPDGAAVGVGSGSGE